MSIFTKIINGEIPGSFAWSDDVCVAFADIKPQTPGHVMVVPREPEPNFAHLDPDIAAHLMKVSQIIARAQEKAFDAERAGLVIEGFLVPHTHLHVFPMNSPADMETPATREAETEEIVAAMTKLREQLAADGYAANVPASVDSPKL
ncbi:MAG: HIT family protein [Flaviflexus sp.]|nr:HIT family protein [Flaviflexus sp.]